MDWNNILKTIQAYWGYIIHWLPLTREDWLLNLPRLIDSSRIFQANPGSRFKFFPQFTILFSLLLILALFVYLKKRKTKNNPPKEKFFKRFFIYLLSFSLTGYLLLFFRYENVKYLSARFLLYVFFLIFFIWGARILLFKIRKLQAEEKDYQTYLIKQKYMPKRKARRE